MSNYSLSDFETRYSRTELCDSTRDVGAEYPRVMKLEVGIVLHLVGSLD